MSDPIVPTPAADALLAQADALHDDDPARALELLRTLDVAALEAGRLGRLSFLLDHVTGEKFGLWDEAIAGLRNVVARAGADVTPLILRHAAIAAHIAADDALAREWTQALAASADAPLDKARALVALGAVQFSASRLSAVAVGRQALHALQPLGARPVDARPPTGAPAQGRGAPTRCHPARSRRIHECRSASWGWILRLRFAARRMTAWRQAVKPLGARRRARR